MKNNLIKCIGLELADTRRTNKLQIAKVAKDIGVNKDTICKYENGNSSIKIYILSKMLDYYNVSINVFFANVYDRMQK